MATSKRRAPKKRRRLPWTRRTELATLAFMPADAKEMHAAFTALDFASQMQVVDEIVTTRSAELCRAYRDVVGVAAGVRLQRERKNGKLGERQVVREPCVTLLVRAKHEAKAVPRERMVPKHLFAYATAGDRRRLCAVPTDVEDGRHYAAIKPDASTTVVVDGDTFGTLVCAITRSSQPLGSIFAIGCRHVLSAPGAGATLTASGRNIGVSIDVRGELSPRITPCLDAQLAKLQDADAKHAVFGRLQIKGMAASLGEVRALPSYFIVTPDGPIEAHYAGEAPVEWAIDYPELGPIHHALLLKSLPETPTSAGHSGSPVLTDPDGGVLLGMHIGANVDERIAYMIPAWHLLDAKRYANADGEAWDLV